MDIATATPAEIDGEIARIANRAAGLRDTIARAERAIRDAEAYRAVGDAAYADEITGRQRATIAECHVRLVELENASAPLRAEYARLRWTRVYLVENSNGHVHTTTACRNTYRSTVFAWITELSGATPEEVVAKAGGRSCLTCFGAVRDLIVADRPCLIESEKGRATREQREAKAAEKAARDAAKAAKAITNPDGSPLRTEYSGLISTVVTAIREYTDAAADAQEWETKLQWARESTDVGSTHTARIERCTRIASDHRRDADIILAAIAHKRGEDVETVRGELAPKVAKKVRDNR